jgi:hypothetical protein
LSDHETTSSRKRDNKYRAATIAATNERQGKNRKTRENTLAAGFRWSDPQTGCCAGLRPVHTPLIVSQKASACQREFSDLRATFRGECCRAERLESRNAENAKARKVLLMCRDFGLSYFRVFVFLAWVLAVACDAWQN